MVDLWMYKGAEGDGQVFFKQTAVDIAKLEKQGWRDCPDKAKKVITDPYPNRESKSEPRRKMFVEKMTHGRKHGNS